MVNLEARCNAKKVKIVMVIGSYLLEMLSK
jgi:hypothetical protein